MTGGARRYPSCVRFIKQADPAVVEEWKWRGVPVWSHNGLICTGETYKNVVKLTFFKGAQLKDPKKLFNSSLEGNARRAIDFHEGDKVDEAAFKALIREALTLNSVARRSGCDSPARDVRRFVPCRTLSGYCGATGPVPDEAQGHVTS